MVVYNKKVMPVASAICAVMSEKNIPDVGVQFHKLSPAMHNVEAGRS